MNRFLNLSTFYFIFCCSIITICFFYITPKSGVYIDRSSESLIIGRLIESEKNGVLSHGGLTGRLIPENTDRDSQSYRTLQYDLAQKQEKNIDHFVFTTYDSQSGIQAWLYAYFNTLTPQDLFYDIPILRFINCLFIAFILTFFIFWVQKEFSYSVSITVLILTLLSPWLYTFAYNLWWSLWAFYLPFSTALFINYNRHNLKKQISLPKELLLIALAVFIKCCFNGYEFITTVLLAIYIPYLYYYLKENLSFKATFKKAFYVGVASILAVITQMLVLIFQFKLKTGSLQNGLNHILHSYNKRSTAEANIKPDWTTNISENEFVQVLLKYIAGNAFHFNFFQIHVYFIYIIIVISITLIYLYLKNKQKYKPIIITTIVSVIPSLSWLILFKQHSLIHTQLNFIVWYIPFFLFGFICIGIILNLIFKNLKFYK